MSPEERDDQTQEKERGHGAEGGDSEAKDKAPGVPADDSSEVGDTDQHSQADA